MILWTLCLVVIILIVSLVSFGFLKTGRAMLNTTTAEVKEDGKYTFTLKTYPADDY